MFGLLIVAYSALFLVTKIPSGIAVTVFSLLYVLYSCARVGGVDTPAYRTVFGNPDTCSRFEYGFSFLCSYDSPTGFSFLFFFSSILMLFTLYKLSSSLKVFVVVLCILFPIYFIIVDMGYLRQSIATSLIYLFCANEQKKSIRFLGYIAAAFFHIATSAMLIFFFELLYSKKNAKLSIIIPLAMLLFFAAYKISQWIDVDLIGLIQFKSLNFKSMIQLIFLLSMNFVAAIKYKWRPRVVVFVTLVCVAGYCGHLYRLYLMIFPFIALGVARFMIEKKMALSLRFSAMFLILVFGFAKLDATIYDDGTYDLPYSENSLFLLF